MSDLDTRKIITETLIRLRQFASLEDGCEMIAAIIITDLLREGDHIVNINDWAEIMPDLYDDSTTGDALIKGQALVEGWNACRKAIFQIEDPKLTPNERRNP